MDDNLRGSIIDSIIAEGRGISEGSLRKLLIDTDSRVRAFQNLGKQLSYTAREGMCSRAFAFL